MFGGNEKGEDSKLNINEEHKTEKDYFSNEFDAQVKQNNVNNNIIAKTNDDAPLFTSESYDYVKFLEKKEKYNKLSKVFLKKELFDRIGYGFVPNQFLIIFMFLLGFPVYLVGILNGLKDFLTVFSSSFLRELSQYKEISNKFISIMGYIFGFSFLIIAFAIKSRSILIFSIFFILGVLGIVTYGELYTKLLQNTIKYEKRTSLLKGIVHKGLILTAISFLISGILLDYLGLVDTILNFKIFQHSFQTPINGYLIIFEIAALCFIFSGYILSKLPSLKPVKKLGGDSFHTIYWHQTQNQIKLFFTNKTIRLMILSSILIGVFQSIGNAYYGFYIYKNFRNAFFGGFTNISVIFVFAILISFLGPVFTNFLRRKIGVSPTFVFGTLLLCIVPLVLIYNFYFSTVIVAISLSVFGNSMVGLSQSILAKRLLKEEERELYYQSLSIMSLIPFLIFVPALAFIAHIYGYIILFQIIIALFILVVLPINLRLVYINRNQKL